MSAVLHGRPGGEVAQLLRRARLELEQADAETDERIRFLHAHMSAIRAGAAVVAMLPRRAPRSRRRVTSVWEQLSATGEPWDRWARRLEAGAPLRAAIEAGRVDALSPGVADEAQQLAEVFLDEVALLVGSDRAPALAS